MIRTIVAAVSLACACPVAAIAGSVGPLSDLVVFGDSYSDGGNVFALTGGTTPDPDLYPDGQFTNGDTWATQVGLAPSALGGTNYAVGGAEAQGEAPVGAEPDERGSDLFAQVGQFLAAPPELGDHSTAAIFIGGNDANEAGTPEAFAREAGVIINAIVRNTQRLLTSDTGIGTVAVFGIFDLGQFPGVVDDDEFSAGATEASEAYNEALQATLAANFAEEETIFIDTFDIFNSIFADPVAFGLDPDLLTEGCIFAEADPTACTGDLGYFFQDNLHATEAVHTAIADAFTATIAPVPLPAGLILILTGAGALLGLRRRTGA